MRLFDKFNARARCYFVKEIRRKEDKTVPDRFFGRRTGFQRARALNLSTIIIDPMLETRVFSAFPRFRTRRESARARAGNPPAH